MALAVTTDSVRTLHRLHRQLEDLRGQLTAGPRAIDARTKLLDAASSKLATIQAEVKKAKMVADQKQLQLRSSETRLNDLDAKLNACKTNREYQILQDQIAADKMALKVLEDEILEALERVDSIRLTQPAAEAEVSAAEKVLADIKAKVSAEKAALESEVSRVSGDLERAEAELPPDSRDPYRRSVKSKGADGMAVVDGESCGGCYQQLTGNMVAELSMARVVPCRSCGRLLYMNKDH
ncbi:MAG: phospholipase [Planctomycetota bacterium]|nr:MAG: phospholipase [Planctomycetota bacterium]